jgi:hypothetical protein
MACQIQLGNNNHSNDDEFHPLRCHVLAPHEFHHDNNDASVCPSNKNAAGYGSQDKDILLVTIRTTPANNLNLNLMIKTFGAKLILEVFRAAGAIW